jgi:hypothetical protein
MLPTILLAAAGQDASQAPAIPPYTPDVAALERTVGRQLAYIAQLHALIEQRAVEANRLDDELTAARAQLSATGGRTVGDATADDAAREEG